MVWEVDHDCDPDQLCDTGYVPAMWGYCCLPQQMPDAQGENKKGKNKNYLKVLLITDCWWYHLCILYCWDGH